MFNEYAREKLKLSDGDVKKFRELNLLSAKALLRGQLTTLGAKVDVWWARDHCFEEPDLSDFVKKGLVEKALAETAEAVSLWRRIEALAREINFADRETQAFVETSATHGRIKYDIIRQAWTVLRHAQQGEAARQQHQKQIGAAIVRYDALRAEWRELERTHPTCASIHKDVGFDHHPGLGAAINRYRETPASKESGATGATGRAESDGCE